MKIFVLPLIAIISFQCAYAQVNLDSGLVGHYPFNGNANDESGSGFHGSVNGATLTVDRFGNLNQAYNFNGVSDNIVFPTAFDYPERTVNAWFRADIISSTVSWIYSSDDNSLAYGSTNFYVHVLTGQKSVKMNIGNSGGGAAIVTINENEWYMVTLTASTSGIRYYLNCTLIDSIPFINWSSSTSGNTYASLGQSRINDRFFDGQIDELRVYDRVLNSMEIDSLFLYQEGACLQTIYDTVIVNDTIFTTVYDTVSVTVTDTIAVLDTTYVTVTDTLLIDIQTGLAAPDDVNTIRVYPNPASDMLTIDNGNFSSLSNYTIEIKTNIGAQVFFSVIDQQSFTVDISQWAAGLYYINTINPGGQIVDTRKIVLQ